MRTPTIALSALLAASAFADTTPAAKCQAGKQEAAGIYAVCRAKAERKRIVSGDLSKYDEALEACRTKLARLFARLEERASKKDARCPTVADVLYIKNLVDVHIQDVGSQLVVPPLRFIDNGNGTITDNKSGLTWEKKVRLDGATEYANLHDADNGFFWAGTCSENFHHCQPSAAAAAACAAGVQGDATGCTQCDAATGGTCLVAFDVEPDETTVWQWLVELNAANFAGHNDWRVPTVSELFGIVDHQAAPGGPTIALYPFHGAGCGPSCTDLHNPSCSCTKSYVHHTATTDFADPLRFWFVDFGTAKLDSILKNSDMWVRAVRGP